MYVCVCVCVCVLILWRMFMHISTVCRQISLRAWPSERSCASFGTHYTLIEASFARFSVDEKTTWIR